MKSPIRDKGLQENGKILGPHVYGWIRRVKYVQEGANSSYAILSRKSTRYGASMETKGEQKRGSQIYVIRDELS